MDFRCVKCGHGIEKLYVQYSPGNIRLLKCSNCKSVADEYIECELMILIIDLILHKPQVYRWVDMDPQKNQVEAKSAATPPSPTLTSCRKKKKDDSTFVEDIKDHIDEFINASMDEHRSCFTKTVQKMFGMSKIVAQRNSEQQEVVSTLPLQTTVSK